jgi:hypothetical protein
MNFPTAVQFAHPDGGYEGDQQHAQRCGLVPGQVYVLRSVTVGQSDTYLELDGFPAAERFSSCLFEPYDPPDDDDTDSEPGAGGRDAALARGLLQIADAVGMPDTYWRADSRVTLAREVLGVPPDGRDSHQHLWEPS